MMLLLSKKLLQQLGPFRNRLTLKTGFLSTIKSIEINIHVHLNKNTLKYNFQYKLMTFREPSNGNCCPTPIHRATNTKQGDNLCL